MQALNIWITSYRPFVKHWLSKLQTQNNSIYSLCIHEIVQSKTIKCLFLKFYLSYFMFLTKPLPFQFIKNSVIENQIIKKNDNHFQDQL